MTIRVLQIVNYMGRGGLETLLMNYYRHIDRTKVQFDFLVHRSFESDYDREILELGGKIYRMPRLNPFSPKYLASLDAFFEEHTEYRVVHSHFDCMSAIPLKAAKQHGVPFCIAHSHNSNQERNLKYPLKLWYKRQIPRYADKLFACSSAAGKWMFDGAPFSVLNNAIDAKAFSFHAEKRNAARAEFHLDPETLLVGHVGRFLTQKNHGFLVDAFRELLKQRPNANLLLVGDGDLQEEVKAKARQYSIDDRIIFAGVRSDVADLMQAMDVFVLPSLFEGLPVVMVEAQSAGLPCVISDKVPDECIIVPKLVCVQPLDSGATEWAGQILKMSGCKRLDTFEQIRASGFDIRDNAKKLEEFYFNLIN